MKSSLDIALDQSKPHREILKVLLSKALYNKDSNDCYDVSKSLTHHLYATSHPPGLSILISLLPPDLREQKVIGRGLLIENIIEYFMANSISDMEKIEKGEMKVRSVNDVSTKESLSFSPINFQDRSYFVSSNHKKAY